MTLVARLSLILLVVGGLHLGLANAAGAQVATTGAAPKGRSASQDAAQRANAPVSPSQVAPAPSETEEHIGASIDALSKAVTRIQKDVDVSNPSTKELAKLAIRIAPLSAKAQALVERLTPRVAAMKARVDQLGATPGAKAPAESAAVAKDRITTEQAFSANDDLLKRAKALAIQTQQLQTYVAKRQRTRFTRSLFQRSDSILSPQLWFSVAAETPEHLAEVRSLFDDWISKFNESFSGGALIVFWIAVLVVVGLYWPLTFVLKHVLFREQTEATPSVWRKIMLACWTSVSVAAPMIAVMYGVVYVFSFASISNERIMPVFLALQLGVVRIALAAGLSRSLLAPHRSRSRLVDLDDTTCKKLVRIAVGVALIVTATKVIEAINVAIVASVQYSIAARGIGALLVAIALAAALIDLGDKPEAGNPVAEQKAAPRRREWYGLIRVFACALIVVIMVAVLVGFSPFASFLVDQIVLVAATGAVLFLLVRLIDKACELGFRPNAIIGRTLLYTVGVRRETLGQLSILLSGAARLTLVIVAAIIIVAPWGMQSTDIAGNVHAIFFGFKIGDITISIEGIAVAILIFLAVLAATRALQNWLENRYLPETHLDSGLRNSIKTSLGYAGFIIALALAAGNLGLDFQKLAIVAGALSLGIGFGLQSIVNNFVSGLILLWERAVRVGDWIVVGSDQGYVRRINVRSTEIETFDRAAVIVPNSNLVSGIVKNLMRTDSVGRLTVEIAAHITADAEKVREVLIAIARDNEAILSLPSPQVRFTNLTSSQMTFSLFCFVADVENSLRTKSDLYFEICKQFRQNGFFDGPPPAPMGIDIVGLNKLESLLKSGQTVDPESVRARESA